MTFTQNKAVATADEAQLRIDLAAALRLAARNDWHEGVANHFPPPFLQTGSNSWSIRAGGISRG